MSIGSNIKRRRFEIKMSQQELADAMGYSTRSTIAKIESGENNINLDKLKKIAEILETTVEDLIIGSEININSQLKTTVIKNNAKNTAAILAGGKSAKNNQNIPTQFASVLGKPLIIYALETYQNHPSIDDIVVVCLKGWESILQSYIARYKISKVSKILTAGASAVLSAKLAFDYLQSNNNSDNNHEDDVVIFQEATRPLVPEALISKLIYSAREHNNAITYESMQEYIQFYQDNIKTECLDRNKIIAVQGPEAYTVKSLQTAFEKGIKTNHKMDESCCYMFLYNMGEKLWFEEGSRNNIKVVRQEDILLLEALLKN